MNIKQTTIGYDFYREGQPNVFNSFPLDWSYIVYMSYVGANYIDGSLRLVRRVDIID